MIKSEFSLDDGYKSIAKVVKKEEKKKEEKGKDHVDRKEDKKKNKVKSNKYLYLKDAENNSKPNRNFKLDKPDKILLPLMVRQAGGHPNRIFIAGASLSGKSYLAMKLAQDYNDLFPKNNVILFSYIKTDNNLNKKNIKNFKLMRIDEEMLDSPIDLSELNRSCVIFDDIEHFTDKYIREELVRLRTACLNAGRHDNIDVIVCRQNLLDSSKTRDVLNGAFQVIGFPHSSSRYQFSEWLKRYVFLPPSMIKKILNVDSRWCLINNATPPYCLHERGAFLLTDNAD